MSINSKFPAPAGIISEGMMLLPALIDLNGNKLGILDIFSKQGALAPA